MSYNNNHRNGGLKRKRHHDHEHHRQHHQHESKSITIVSSEERSALEQFRKELPVYAYKHNILKAIDNHDVLLITAETGSGKSTQIPAYLAEHQQATNHSNYNVDHSHNNKHHTHNKHHKQYATTICVTQPRRVAAITVAQRVAKERGCSIGTSVGYRVRFQDCSNAKTKILFVTDGMLLREAMMDPLLRKYSIVVLDESHERSLQTDILFGVVKRAMKARRQPQQQQKPKFEATAQGSNDKDEKLQQLMYEKAKEWKLPILKVVVMSATLQIQTFQDFFATNSCTTIQIPGRLYPVQIVYTKEPQEDYIDSALSTALQIHYETADRNDTNGNKEDAGDILIFLSGQEEIEDLHQLLKRYLQEEQDEQQQGHFKDIVQSVKGVGTTLTSQKGAATIVNGVMICVLYAALPPEVQVLAFQSKPKNCTRKIILATNIAETSVTLDGIRYVIDCGKHKTRNFSSTTGMESLTVQEISQAQALQRTGRAGRVQAGICFRLYTEDAFDHLASETIPEIARVNLAQVVLMLKGMGVHDPTQFDYLTLPSTGSLKRACQLLYALGALTTDLEITGHGKKMAMLPVDPIYGHLLLQSSKYSCAKEMLTAVAMLSAENVLYRPGGDAGGPNENSMSSMAQKAAQAHRRFASYEGDLPTLLAIYQAWRKEAIYMPNNGGKHKHGSHSTDGNKLPHGQWCARNFISGRALVRAFDVRHQLSSICSKDTDKGGLGIDVSESCGDDIILFLKCACAGLFLQSATRLSSTKDLMVGNNKGSRGNSGRLGFSRGRYKTKVGGEEASIHPTSTLFGRNPAPKTVVYTELLVTKKTYLRSVTQIREEWLVEVAPEFFK